MQILIFILSALAVVIAGAALILVLQEKQRTQELAAAVDQRFKGMSKTNKESKTAMLHYVDEENKKISASVEKTAKETNDRLEKVFSAVKSVNRKAEEAKKVALENEKHIEDLEQGIVPDFETARKAVDEVNRFNEGIAGILGFDPLQAMKKGRQEDD